MTQRMSDERMAELVARRNLGPGVSHNEIADLIDDAVDARAALAALREALERLRTWAAEACWIMEMTDALLAVHAQRDGDDAGGELAPRGEMSAAVKGAGSGDQPVSGDGPRHTRAPVGSATPALPGPPPPPRLKCGHVPWMTMGFHAGCAECEAWNERNSRAWAESRALPTAVQRVLDAAEALIGNGGCFGYPSPVTGKDVIETDPQAWNDLKAAIRAWREGRTNG